VEERDLARLCVDITLQQRNNGKVHVDVEKLEARNDVSLLDVHKEAVGFVLVNLIVFEFLRAILLYVFLTSDSGG
jgi:hypothetical protein